MNQSLGIREELSMLATMIHVARINSGCIMASSRAEKQAIPEEAKYCVDMAAAIIGTSEIKLNPK